MLKMSQEDVSGDCDVIMTVKITHKTPELIPLSIPLGLGVSPQDDFVNYHLWTRILNRELGIQKLYMCNLKVF